MYSVEERLIAEVRKHEHLYCNAAAQHKDSRRVRNTWRKIAQDIGLDEIECTKRWRNLRDKYVRLRKKLSSQSGDSANTKLPAFYHRMMWLGPHVTHREEESRRSPGAKRTSKPVSKNQTSASPSSPEPSILSSPSAALQPQPQPQPQLQHQPELSSDSRLPPHHRLDHRCCCHGSPWGQGRLPEEGALSLDEALVRQIGQLQDRWLEAQCKLQEDRDECSRFGLTVADMLRRVPEEKRSDVMFLVYKTLYDERQK